MGSHESGNLIDFDYDDSPPASNSVTPFPANQNQPPTTASSQSTPRQSPSPLPPLRHASTTSSTSSSYGLGSAVWGLFRRISNVDGSSGQSYAHSHPHNASQGDGISGAFTPPRRTATPRGLPSLDPLTLHGFRDDTDSDERLLARGVAEEIRTFLPERLKIMDDWRLVYSLYQNGSSLSTLYQLCEKYRGVRAGFVLVVRDGKYGTFGAYLTEAPHPAASYYGTGECFLWRASLHAPLPPPPSSDTTHINYRMTTIASPTRTKGPSSSSPSSHAHGTRQRSHQKAATIPAETQPAHSVRFQTFAYTGANDYCMFCETKFLSVGGGHAGTFGLWLNDSLSRGHSAECDTFLNQPLSEEGEKFEVLGVELWVVGAN
ncbi:TLD-domain-containing protein [Xylaria sp. CBS 124048]|nr:TLD-domain-containing protein [Xylaria sp. CBS 124048]